MVKCKRYPTKKILIFIQMRGIADFGCVIAENLEDVQKHFDDDLDASRLFD